MLTQEASVDCAVRKEAISAALRHLLTIQSKAPSYLEMTRQEADMIAGSLKLEEMMWIA